MTSDGSVARDRIIAVIRGDTVAWTDVAVTASEVLASCRAHELSGLVYEQLRAGGLDWPDDVVSALASDMHAETVAELLRARELQAALAALAAAGILPVLLKGAALAYTLYGAPASRPRSDTDMLVRTSDVESVRHVLVAHGYRLTPHCDELFSQFEVQKRDRFGFTHAIDVHWKISTQPAFAEVLDYDEVSPRTEPIPALGPHARGLSAADALLLACVHPVMHHQNHERPLWVYDVHLLASQLSGGEFESFAAAARRKRVAAVCARGLRLAAQMFRTQVPDDIWRHLDVRDEPSAAYLAPNRRWHDELASSIRDLPSWSGRLRLLREVLFPNPEYMLGAYRLSNRPFGSVLLPALYVHRNLRGAWKIFAGKK